MKRTVGIALLGCGTVGASVAERLLAGDAMLFDRTGMHYELHGIAVRAAGKVRPASVPAQLFTLDAARLVDDPDVDVVIECIGGADAGADVVERALARGKHVVTANKDLIATQGPRLHALAASRGVALRYEAAACGAIPVVRALGESLAGDEVLAIAGVMNGTCTAILSMMEEGCGYEDALAEAQRLGYAEADPTSDVEGYDAAHKLALLLQLGFREAVVSPRIARTGIAGVAKRDIAHARMRGYRIRLVAAAARDRDGTFAEVAPVLVPESHPFARTRGPENVVRVVARDAGPMLMSGLGAGGAATASAVMGDVVATLRSIAEQQNFGLRARLDAFAAPGEIRPFFDRFARDTDLPAYPLWQDDVPKARSPRRNAVSGC